MIRQAGAANCPVQKATGAAGQERRLAVQEISYVSGAVALETSQE